MRARPGLGEASGLGTAARPLGAASSAGAARAVFLAFRCAAQSFNFWSQAALFLALPELPAPAFGVAASRPSGGATAAGRRARGARSERPGKARSLSCGQRLFSSLSFHARLF